jgi:hypothetical protein
MEMNKMSQDIANLIDKEGKQEIIDQESVVNQDFGKLGTLTLDTTIKEVSIPANFMMGFGYNPRLSEAGERLDILQYFSWMKVLQEKGIANKWFIWDASCYAIVNSARGKNFKKLGDNPEAESILEFLMNELARPKKQQIRDNCELRGAYLRKAMEIVGMKTGFNAKYIDAKKVIEQDPGYAIALEFALEYVQDLEKTTPDLIARINPKNPNPVSKLYLPLEIAETIYLRETYDALVKFGPDKEEDFDKCIIGFNEDNNTSYATIRCNPGPRKSGYLDDELSVRTSSPDKYVKELLDRDKPYRDFVRSFLASVETEKRDLLSSTLFFRDQLKQGRLEMEVIR